MYKITIEKTIIENKETTEWEKLHNKVEFDNKIEPQYGYVKIEQDVPKTEEIYQQVANYSINLKLVIDAFNTPK